MYVAPNAFGGRAASMGLNSAPCARIYASHHDRVGTDGPWSAVPTDPDVTGEQFYMLEGDGHVQGQAWETRPTGCSTSDSSDPVT